jgi:hypothetical protein
VVATIERCLQMSNGFTTVELTRIRDSLLKVTPSRNEADELWEIIEKITNAIEGASVERAKKIREAKPDGRNKKQ